MNPYRCTTPSLTALLYIIAVFSISGSSIFTNADSPFDWEPSVSLTADLDEPQQWGFCIDIRGWRGNCDELQARSCKTSGDDTQFEYDLSTKALRAVNYSPTCNYSPSTPSNNRACVKVSDDFDAMVDGVGFALGQCDGSERQTFELVEVDSSNSSFELHAGTGLCLSVSDTSMIPGPGAPALAVMRFLTLSDCDSVPAELKAWTIRPNPLESDQSPTSSPTIDPTSSTTISEQSPTSSPTIDSTSSAPTHSNSIVSLDASSVPTTGPTSPTLSTSASPSSIVSLDVSSAPTTDPTSSVLSPSAITPEDSSSPTTDPTSSTTIVNAIPIIIMILQFMMCIPGV